MGENLWEGGDLKEKGRDYPEKVGGAGGGERGEEGGVRGGWGIETGKGGVVGLGLCLIRVDAGGGGGGGGGGGEMVYGRGDAKRSKGHLNQRQLRG